VKATFLLLLMVCSTAMAGDPIIIGRTTPSPETEPCAGDPPCPDNHDCPPGEWCHGWDAVCGCDTDRRSNVCSTKTGNPDEVLATFDIHETDAGMLAILSGVIQGRVKHSDSWGGGEQFVSAPNASITVRTEGPVHGSGRHAGWDVLKIRSVDVVIPGFASVAVDGKRIGDVRMSLCVHGRNPEVAKIYVHPDGRVQGWIPLDIEPPSLGDGQAWTGLGYAAIELRGVACEKRLCATADTRVKASSTHP